MDGYRLLRPLLFALPPETAHGLALTALRLRFLPPARQPASAALRVQAFGLTFDNPVGLAAGFDKNAHAIDAALAQGFGFVEAGTVTPKPQAGNPRPRLFRLEEDEAIINRLGFNNKGVEAFVANLRRPRAGIVGANIGRNRDTQDPVQDYLTLLEAVAPHADYVAVNVSSPNTQGLRALQERKALDALLAALMRKRRALARPVPLLLKVAPDLDTAQREAIAGLVLAHGVDGLIVGNTTLSRPALTSRQRDEAGGLSGRPLYPLSTEVVRSFYRLTQGRIPLIGVGGILSGEDAYAKIRAGASLVQVYTGLIYRGFGLVREINATLERCLKKDGISSIQAAVGKDA